MRPFQKLFEPGRIGTLEVKNRIAMAPMGTQMYADGFVTGQLRDYYEARAKAEVHLIGDCVQPCGILDAIHGAFIAARAI
jgi:2,4-dienoyl-CoA reductase-like NADH-dependent reductase (Old Yellow Enzyme family)